MKIMRIAPPVAAAGLFTGAAAWALQQQASYVLASIACASGQTALWGVGALALLLLAAGFALSLFAYWRLRKDPRQDDGRPSRFLAQVGIMAAALFLFAIVLQIAAFFFLPVCVS